MNFTITGFTMMLTLLVCSLNGQEVDPEMTISSIEAEGHLRYLASDALKGRRTGEEGNNIAANYIAQYFKTYGVQTIAGAPNYYQPMSLVGVLPPNKGELSIGRATFSQLKDLLILRGDQLREGSTTAVFAGQGWVDPETGHDDYGDLDVKGKIVIVAPGTPEGDSRSIIFRSMAKKRAFAAERGAIAIFELYRIKNFPWNFFQNYFGKESLSVEEASAPVQNITYGWIKESEKSSLKALFRGKLVKASLNHPGVSIKQSTSQNVVGVIPGNDLVLRDEYVLLTAHYDHVGTGKNGGGAFTEQDSIFNGARDNGFGTVALLSAAKALAAKPAKRSVIVLAVTGEEVGFLGSSFYASHPLVALDQTVFNLNTDGAGYNDKHYITVVGLGRTGTDDQIRKGVEAIGLTVLDDPAPEQGLFDRSDNVSFAKKGVPCLTFSPGFTGFTGDILKYYHQVGDEADSVDFDYLRKFCQSFAHTGRLIANMESRPFWVIGDKYEEVGKKLYNR